MMYNDVLCIIVMHNDVLLTESTMPRNVSKKARISASISPEQKQNLEKIAERSDISLSRVIQEAIKEFIDAHPSGTLALIDKPSRKD